MTIVRFEVELRYDENKAEAPRVLDLEAAIRNWLPQYAAISEVTVYEMEQGDE